MTLVYRSGLDLLLSRETRPDVPAPRKRPLRQQWEAFDRYLAKTYAITSEDWARLFESQRGACPGCSRALAFDRTTHVDHDHATGAVRGLLCGDCNLAVGNARDCPATLRALAHYLDQHNTHTISARTRLLSGAL